MMFWRETVLGGACFSQALSEGSSRCELRTGHVTLNSQV